MVVFCTASIVFVIPPGTGHNKAIQRLLHVAVSDVNDDVRRAAVEALGFLLFNNPEQCPSVVSLLSESYNPHVRYGAAMALGISCAGTGLKEAINILEPLTADPVNYVRQGALLASALVLVNTSEALNPKVRVLPTTSFVILIFYLLVLMTQPSQFKNLSVYDLSLSLCQFLS